MKAQRVTRGEVMVVPMPDFTKTWKPYSHRIVLDVAEIAMKKHGLEMVSESYSLTKGGDTMFGSWVLDFAEQGINLQVGFRNSINKRCAVGFVSGTYVVVCSNMQFKGDFIDVRKHNGTLDESGIQELANNAFLSLVRRGIQDIRWQLALKTIPLEGNRFKAITYDALDMGIIPPKHFGTFQNAYEEEQAINPDSLYAFHGAITRMNRNLSLFSINDRTQKLADLVNNYSISDSTSYIGEI